MRCSAGWSSPPGATGPRWASWTPRPAGPPTPGGQRLAPYWDEHDVLAHRRGRPRAGLLVVDEPPTRRWQVRQILHDPDGTTTGRILATVDLAASDEAGYAVVRLDEITGG